MELTRLFDFIYYQNEKLAQAECMGHRPEGEWIYYSTQEVIDLGNQVSTGLLKLGVKPGDKIAVATYKNRPEWAIVDLGIQQIGAINVPVYPTISAADYEYIFNDAEVKYCFVGSGDLYEKTEIAQKKVPSLKQIFTFDKQPGKPYWKDMFGDADHDKVAKLRDEVKPDELATIIYTSGTTGNPKGVMLSHTNIVHVVLETVEILQVEKSGEKVLSFLPLCHIFERAVLYGYIYKGVSIHFVGVDNLGGEDGDLKSVKPVFFTTVPRLLEKVYEAIYNKGLALSGAKKKLFFWALSLTNDYEYDQKQDGLKWKIADKLIFSKWREGVGGNVRGIVSGAAACPRKIAQVFSAAGIPVREGYGLTETSPVLTVGRFIENGSLLGTVGYSIDKVDLMIDDSDGTYAKDEGEILAKGPNIMMGYYNKPDETAKVMKEIDGVTWFCTGDIGKLIDGPGGKQFLKITDRKKQLLKTSGGKYVAPAPIENKLKENFLIEQIMVVGEKRKFVSALIVPSVDALKDWCSKNNVSWTTLDDAVKNPDVLRAYQKIIDGYNPDFSHIEQIKKFALLSAQWLPVTEDGSKAELTPTMKLKRRVILEKYQTEIEEIYNV